MNLKLLSLGVIGAPLAGMGALVAWLLWPLPDPAIDWRAEYFEAVQANDCYTAIQALSTASDVEPNAVIEFARANRDALDCGDPEANATLPEYWETLDEFTRLGLKDVYVDGGLPTIAANWRDWMTFIRHRRNVGRFPFSFVDLRQSFRCNSLYLETRSHYWYGVRNSIFFFDQDASNLIPAWESRIEECEQSLADLLEQMEQLKVPGKEFEVEEFRFWLAGKSDRLVNYNAFRDQLVPASDE